MDEYDWADQERLIQQEIEEIEQQIKGGGTMEDASQDNA